MNKRTIINIIITLVFALVLYYIFLPAINLSYPGFYVFVGVIVLFYTILNSIKSYSPIQIINHNYFKDIKSFYKVIIGLGTCGLLIIIINFICSPLFNAKSYANRISIDETGVFTKDIAEVDFDKIPLLDKDSSEKLGDRKMGQISSLVSQFYVSNLYTQINYNNKIIRVTPLEYASAIKYFTNRKEGVAGYITVNSVTGESELVELDNKMRYMPSALLFENLYRKLRFTYPTEIFGKESFEIDNDGNPYWIIPTIKYTAIGLKEDIDGVIILNPITGDSKKYNLDEVPTWVDHVYSADLIIDQVNNWGEYKNGYINSIFGQKDVVNTTEGYSYIAMNDDIYLYTGITSVSSDESNLGFILTNMRTKETIFYSVPGAEEYSAMASAEGLAQEKRYKASFPLLINLNNTPTYLLSLKDNAGLVKMYAFVDVKDYQKVTVSDSSIGIAAAANKYLKEYISNPEGEVVEKAITIKTITPVIIDNNTIYYILDQDNEKYSANVNIDKINLPFLKSGDKINISYNKGLLNIINSIN